MRPQNPQPHNFQISMSGIGLKLTLGIPEQYVRLSQQQLGFLLFMLLIFCCQLRITV